MDRSSCGRAARSFLALIALSLPLVSPVLATPWDASPVGTGMGGAHMAAARDVDAVLVNPANLALAENSRLAVNLMALRAQAANAGLNLSDIERFLTSDLSQEEKSQLLAAFRGDKLGIDVNGQLDAVGFATHGFAFSTGTYALADAEASRDLVSLLLDDNVLGRTYSMAGTGGSAALISAMTGSWARKVGVSSLAELAVGGSIHYYRGWQYQEIMAASGDITLSLAGLDSGGEVRTRSSESGSGYGFDLGIAARRGEHLVVGLSLQNLAAKINYDQAEETEISFDADSVTVQGLLNGDDVIEALEDTRPLDDFSVTLPATVRMGAGVKYGPLLLASDLIANLGGGGSAFAVPTRLAMGGEYRVLSYLPVRAGVSIGPEVKPRFSAGAGFYTGPLHIDAAGTLEGSMAVDQAAGFGAALGVGFHF